MKISVNWLRELIQLNDLDPQNLAHQLTIAGLEVEGIEDHKSWADGVVVGKVLDRQPHPNANKLSVCQVDIGQAQPSTIVCGAANVRADIYVPVATIGTYLPQVDLTIKPATLRGVESNGMICSLAELGLAKESEGIHIFLQTDLTLGSDVRPLLGLDDVIIEISPTANRSDALSMIGIAKEVAALTGAKITLPLLESLPKTSTSNRLAVKIAQSETCPIYIGTLIEGVTVAPSPQWLQLRLKAAGIRPINNVVDITNYVLLEWGQPLHAFDLDSLEKITEAKNLTLGVRFSQSSESLQTLDGQSYNLTTNNLLITANDRPVAIAGVMGGKETEVQNETKNIILEAAIFNPITIRRSAKAQGIRTEASSRYEKGINLQALETSLQRAINLIQELTGGQVSETVTVDNRPPQNNLSIQLRLERVHKILGPVVEGEGLRPLEKGEIEKILKDLGCQLTSNQDTWSVTVPTHRNHDLQREIDLIEEVARLYSYDRFSDKLPEAGQVGTLSLEEAQQRRIREGFRAVGLTEVLHYSLVKPTGKEVVIANPLLAEYAALRLDLFNGLLEAFEYNYSQGNGCLNAFEIGRVFQPLEQDILEKDLIGGVIGGDLLPLGSWSRSGKPEPMTWYQAKGLLDSVLTGLGLEITYRPDTEDERLHPGRTASLWLVDKYLGRFGQLHPQLRQQKNLPEAVYLFELHLEPILDALSAAKRTRPVFNPYSTYPALERDLAFYAAREIAVTQLEETMSQAGGTLLERVEVFDQYQGENVPSGQRSLAFSLFYRASDRTLTDSEVEPIHNQIREALVSKYQVTLRS